MSISISEGEDGEVKLTSFTGDLASLDFFNGSHNPAGDFASLNFFNESQDSDIDGVRDFFGVVIS